MKACLLLLLSSLLAVEPVFSQVSILKGRLVESGSKSPVPFASVAITHTAFGTAANVDGQFVLPIHESMRHQRINISSIGYYSRSLSIDSLLSDPTGHPTIFLSVNIASLDAIVVQGTRSTPEEIIQQAMASREINYNQQPFSLDLLSVITMRDTVTGKDYTVESVLEGYYEGYNTKGKKKFELIHKRTTGENPLKSINYGYWPSFEIWQADQLTNQQQSGIFNTALHSKFKFTLAGIILYEADTVYQIEYFAPKPSASITGYGQVPKFFRGTVYITTGTHAVVRHEIITSSFRYHVIYRKVNGFYYPYYFSGLREQEFKLPGGKRVLKSFNEIQVNTIKVTGIKPIDPKANEYDVNRVNYDPAFWNVFYPIDK
jgi:hypothetical protein